ncbi:phytoene synthase [Liberibacter crescens]|nr:phytoene synthase [Liberibacter crescens]
MERFSLEILRDIDRDRYLACLLSPKEVRNNLATIYRFNAELARVRDMVTNPLTGEIRFQFWKNLFQKNSNDIETEHSSFSKEVLEAINKYNLPFQCFLDIIEARIFDLYDAPMNTSQQLELYASRTASNIIQLAVFILNREEVPSLMKAIIHAGIAQSIGGLLLLAGLHRSRGQLYLPLDILVATGLNRETFLLGEDRQRISIAINAFSELGLEHLLKARKNIQNISMPILSAFIPVSITESILKKAKSNGADILDRQQIIPQWLRQWHMMYTLYKRRF